MTTEFLEPPPGRCFLFRQTYQHNVEGPIPENLRNLIDSPNRPKGPLLHFHQFQTEYFRVESGIMGIEVDGKRLKVTPEDGEISVKAGSIHQFHIHPDSPGEMTVYLSASDSGMDFQLDRIFFENWYGYWHDAMLHEGGLDIIQYLAVSCIAPHNLNIKKALTLRFILYVYRSKMEATHTRCHQSGCHSVDLSATGPV